MTERAGSPRGGDIPAQESRISSSDGTSLFLRQWTTATPRAVVVLVHGLGEHSGRYAHVAAHLAETSITTVAVDYRGHGLSAGRRVDVSSFDEYVADVRATLAEAARRHPGLPLVLLGHSQGGLVALLTVLAHPQGLAGVVVTSPLLGVHPSAAPGPVMRFLSAVLRRLLPRLVVPNPLDARILSHDPAVAPAYDADPLVSHGVSAGWFAALQAAQAHALSLAHALTVPLLLMASGDDRLVDSRGARDFAARAPAGLVDHVEWPGLFHEMLNETPPLVAPVLARLDAWLQALLTPGER